MKQLLAKAKYFKLVCGAGNENAEEVRKLATVYTLGGANGFDVSAQPHIRKSFLLKYASWSEGKLEQIEFHEHLRILEKGYPIRAVEVGSSAVSVDTQEDLQFVREKMLEDPFFKMYKL